MSEAERVLIEYLRDEVKSTMRGLRNIRNQLEGEYLLAEKVGLEIINDEPATIEALMKDFIEAEGIINLLLDN